MKFLHTLISKIRSFLNSHLNLGSFDEKSYCVFYKNLCLSIIKGLENNDMLKHFNRKVEININRKLDFDAESYISDGTYHIDIDLGVILKAHDKVLELMECKDFFVEYGNTENCEQITPHKEYVFKENKIMFFSGVKDKTRQELASKIAGYMVSFVALHEIMHHFRGHIEYEKHIKGTYEYHIIKDIFVQATEFDADNTAAIFISNYIFECYKNNVIEEFQLWSVAIYILILLDYKEYKYNLKDKKQQNLEYSPYRFIKIINDSYSYLKDIKNINIDYSIIGSIFSMTSTVLLKVGECEFVKVFEDYISSEKILEEEEYLNEEIFPLFNEIAEQLNEYSYIPIDKVKLRH